MAPEEAASNKIFIGLLALIIRCRIYIALKEKELAKKPNYLTVPAAIRELEKIEPTRQLEKVYRLDHAVTKTQKVILSAFGMDWNHVKYRAENYQQNLEGSTVMARNMNRETLEQKTSKNREGNQPEP